MTSTKDTTEVSDSHDIAIEDFFNTNYYEQKSALRWSIENISKLVLVSTTTIYKITADAKWAVDLDLKEGVLKVYPVMDPTNGSYISRVASVIGSDGLKHFKNDVSITYNGSNFKPECLRLKYENIIPNYTPCDTLTLECVMIVGKYETRSLTVPDLPACPFKENFRKLQENVAIADTRLQVGNEHIFVHKAVLSARSPVFSRMFQTNMREQKEDNINVSDIEFQTLKEFVTFLYSAEVKNMTWDKATALYYASNKYDVQDLSAVCRHYLQSYVTVEKSCKLLLLADLHGDDDLKTFALVFIVRHISVILKTPAWKELEDEHPSVALECLKLANQQTFNLVNNA